MSKIISTEYGSANKSTQSAKTADSDDMQKQFEQQLLSFATQQQDYESYISEYHPPSPETPLGGHVLIEVFKFTPELENNTALGVILMPNKNRGNDYSAAAVAMHESYYPIGKVIKSTLSGYNPGDIVKLPTQDIVGIKEHPDWTYAKQFKASNASSVTPVDDNIEQYIPSIEVNWSKYKFSDPTKKESQDDGIYLVTAPKIQGKWPKGSKTFLENLQ